uniref:Putative lipocalin-3 1 n=1 Tax=Amblyomma cajennense TaxID=34607 RepID=A0A023FTY4_AMBCJ
MALFQTFLVSLFAFTAAVVEPREGTETSGDISKFLNANLKIWVYNTSEENKENITCRHDVRYNITEGEIFFHRYNNTSTGELLKGNFVNWNDPKSKIYDAMYVTDARGIEVTDEVIEYLSSDNLCAVVSVTLMRTDQPVVLREIRVSEKALPTGPDDECKKKFDEILKEANKTAKSQYSPACRTLHH